MAVFGLPVAHGDDAERALDAALELRDRVRPTRASASACRSGSASTAARSWPAGIGGRRRLPRHRRRGQRRSPAAAGGRAVAIVVGERTVRAGSDSFAFGPLGGSMPEGKAVPVGAASCSGASRSPRPAQRTRLVGREADLDAARAGRASRLPRAAAVPGHVIAPPGAGKTRLLEEFLDRLPERSS